MNQTTYLHKRAEELEEILAEKVESFIGKIKQISDNYISNNITKKNGISLTLKLKKS